MKILITGCAGFIGSNLTDEILKKGDEVIGIDNFNNYYDPKIKEENIKRALKGSSFKLYREDILNFSKLEEIFKEEQPQVIIHLAARTGVRPSIENPTLYAKVNVEGTLNLLKVSVANDVEKFIFGSSSSVYGNSPNIPFEEYDSCTNIISPYGASKRAAEFFVETFHRTYNLKTAILRFFTVYGKRGRPDMAPALFTKAVLEGKAIQQFGEGSTSRDYTYIDDIVEGIINTMEADLTCETINLGNNHPVKLTDFIRTIEEVIDKKANIEKAQRQAGDAEKTWANIEKAQNKLSWQPKNKLEKGLNSYLKWLKDT